jgi:hypothetical protein
MIFLFMLHGRETRVWHGFFHVLSLQIPSTGVMGSGTSSAEPPTVAALGGTGFTVSPEGRAIHHSSNEHRCHIGGWKMIPYAPWWNIKSNMYTLSKINQFFVGFYIPAPW